MSSYQYSNGVTTTVNRDNQYRITGINTGTDQIMSRTYSFDNVGNILGITDSINTQKNQTLAYDSLYRLTTANGIWGSGSFTYDNVGNRLSKVVGSNTTNYTYVTGKNRLSSSTGAEAATYYYDNNGNITSDGTLTLQYNQNNRLKLITASGVNQTNSYDGLGKRVRVVSDTNKDFLYDLSGNLNSEDNGNSTTDYVYLNGIPVIKVEESNPAPSRCWDFEASSPCITELWQKDGIGYDYTYISSDSTHVISGQHAEKMVAEDTGIINSGLLNLTKTQIETTHRYLDLWVYSDAAQNFEVKVAVDYVAECGQTEIVTILPYTNAVAGWNHVSSDLLSVVNYIEQNFGTYDNLQIKVYNWQGNAIWLDNVSIHQYLIGENGYFVHSDHLGTPQVMSDSGKAIVWQADYMPFGDLYQPSENITLLNFRFPGQYKDLLNLYQNGFRDYNPKVGRYMEADPICQMSDLNLYTYVGNNPVRFTDQFGLAVGDWWDLPANLERTRQIANEELVKRPNSHNDIGDAMRHAEWMRRTTEETNAFTAWLAGTGHEIEGTLNGQPLDEMLMDLHNNSVGRQAGRKNSLVNPGNLWTLPLNGRLYNNNNPKGCSK